MTMRKPTVPRIRSERVTLEDRIAALERQQGEMERIAGANFETIQRRLIDDDRRRIASIEQRSWGRLAGGSIIGPRGFREGLPDQLPEFDHTLMSRLQRDQGLPHAASQADSYSSMPNLMQDPTLDAFVQYGLGTELTVPLATTPIGNSQWTVAAIHNSGTNANQRWLYLASKRGEGTFSGFASAGFSSSVLELWWLWNAGGGAADEDFVLRELTFNTSSYLTTPIGGRVSASVVIYNPELTANMAATATLQITDSTNAILVASDPLDLAEWATGEFHQLFVSTDDISESEYRWRLEINMVRSGALEEFAIVRIAEPMIGMGALDGPMPYSPLAGQWVPDKIRDPYSLAEISAAGSASRMQVFGPFYLTGAFTESPGANQNNWNPQGINTIDGASVLRLTPSAAIDVTGFLAPDVDGKVLVVIQCNANTTTLKHLNGGSSAANQIEGANGLDVVLGNRDVATLWYDPTSTVWRVIGLVQ